MSDYKVGQGVLVWVTGAKVSKHWSGDTKGWFQGLIVDEYSGRFLILFENNYRGQFALSDIAPLPLDFPYQEPSPPISSP